MHPTALLFDLDGTLVDSVAGICASAQAACVSLGLAEPHAAIFRSHIGLPLAVMMRAGLPTDADDALVERGCAEYRRLFDEIGLPTTITFPGVSDALGRWRAQGRRLGVATSKGTDKAQAVLERAGLAGVFEVVVGGDQVALGKPAPDIVLRCLDLLGVAPASAAMVGDTVHDVAMARAAEVAPYAVGYGVHERSGLAAAGALAVVDRFEDLTDFLG